MTSASFLECPICQQSLLITQELSSDNLVENQGQGHDATNRSTDTTSLSSIRWSPVCTPCGHMFHKICITEWFRVRRHYDGGSSIRCSCPSCRKIIAYHKLIRVYLPTTPTNVDGPSSTSPSEISSPVSLCPIPTVPRRFSVSEAVRQYNDQHLRINSGTPQLQRTDASRIYNDFFSICERHRSPPSEDVSSSPSSPSRMSRLNPQPPRHLRNRQGGHSQGYLRQANDLLTHHTPATFSALVEFNCENEDCVALKNVYEVLSMEFKSLQRKLEQEVDIGRMKSILVAGLQRDVEHLKRMIPLSVPMNRARIIGIVILSFFCFWISASAILLLF